MIKLDPIRKLFFSFFIDRGRNRYLCLKFQTNVGENEASKPATQIYVSFCNLQPHMCENSIVFRLYICLIFQITTQTLLMGKSTTNSTQDNHKIGIFGHTKYQILAKKNWILQNSADATHHVISTMSTSFNFSSPGGHLLFAIWIQKTQQTLPTYAFLTKNMSSPRFQMQERVWGSYLQNNDEWQGSIKRTFSRWKTQWDHSGHKKRLWESERTYPKRRILMWISPLETYHPIHPLLIKIEQLLGVIFDFRANKTFYYF